MVTKEEARLPRIRRAARLDESGGDVSAVRSLRPFSNLIGNMILAEILVATMSRISYAAGLVFAGAHLLVTLVVLTLQSRPACALRSVQRHGPLIVYRARAAIRVLAILFWAGLSLAAAGILGDLSTAGADVLQLQWRVGAAEISIQNVAVSLAVLLGAFIVSRTLRFVLSEEVFPRVRLCRAAFRE